MKTEVESALRKTDVAFRYNCICGSPHHAQARSRLVSETCSARVVIESILTDLLADVADLGGPLPNQSMDSADSRFLRLSYTPMHRHIGQRRSSESAPSTESVPGGQGGIIDAPADLLDRIRAHSHRKPTKRRSF